MTLHYSYTVTTVPLKDNVALTRSLQIDTRMINTRCSMYIHSIKKHYGITLELLYNKNARLASIN